ncbi:MAG TPA: hypothetical protein VEA37_10735, partial [Flavobacterium sp.]|nr:hypothetical protein [Flavobacterium sp.]
KFFQEKFVLDNIDEVTYYNVKSFIKTLHTKLYRLSDTIIDPQYQYRVSIDLNEYKALQTLYPFVKESIDNNLYLSIVYLQIFQQCDKQQTDLMDRHKYVSPPPAIVQRKLDNDNLKKLE